MDTVGGFSCLSGLYLLEGIQREPGTDIPMVDLNIFNMSLNVGFHLSTHTSECPTDPWSQQRTFPASRPRSPPVDDGQENAHPRDHVTSRLKGFCGCGSNPTVWKFGLP